MAEHARHVFRTRKALVGCAEGLYCSIQLPREFFSGLDQKFCRIPRVRTCVLWIFWCSSPCERDLSDCRGIYRRGSVSDNKERHARLLAFPASSISTFARS